MNLNCGLVTQVGEPQKCTPLRFANSNSSLPSFTSSAIGFSDQTWRFACKAFLLTGLNEEELSFNVKCDPEKAIEWREQFAAVQPGYHMNKKLWNTVVIDGSISNKILKEMIDDSYVLVVKSLPKKDQP